MVDGQFLVTFFEVGRDSVHTHYSHVEGIFTCGSYSCVKGTFMCVRVTYM